MTVTAPHAAPSCKRDLLPPLWPLSPMPVPRMRKIRPRKSRRRRARSQSESKNRRAVMRRSPSSCELSARRFGESLAAN
jgi:hypothetical protein